MIKNNAKGAPVQERYSARVIHYNFSYIVQNAEFGTDGAIVLLHDIPAGAFAWADILPKLGIPNRAIYAVDMLGYGLTDHPWPADTSIWGHADCLSFLINQLHLTNIILVGHGLGGGVAQVLATRLCRDQVAGLVLIDSIGYEHSFAENWPLTEMSKRQDPDLPKLTHVEDMIKDLRATLPNATQNPKAFEATIDQYVTPWESELGKEVLFQHIRTLIPNYSNSIASDLKSLGKPTLIIWGEQDQQMPIKLGQRLARDIPGALLVTVAEARHLILFDAPNAVAKAIVNFVAQL